jgi:hypothetical protein
MNRGQKIEKCRLSSKFENPVPGYMRSSLLGGKRSSNVCPFLKKGLEENVHEGRDQGKRK